MGEIDQKATRVELETKMQSTTSRNIDQRCYRRNQPLHASLEKTNKDSKNKVLKLKAQEPKSSSNSFRITETSNKAQKKKKKHWRQKHNKKVSNTSTSSISTFEVNTTNNSSREKCV